MRWHGVSPDSATLLGAITPVLGLFPVAAVTSLRRGFEMPFHGPVSPGSEALLCSPFAVVIAVFSQPVMTVALLALGAGPSLVAYELSGGGLRPWATASRMLAGFYVLIVTVGLLILHDHLTAGSLALAAGLGWAAYELKRRGSRPPAPEVRTRARFFVLVVTIGLLILYADVYAWGWALDRWPKWG
jgi:hypothetical protein